MYASLGPSVMAHHARMAGSLHLLARNCVVTAYGGIAASAMRVRGLATSRVTAAAATQKKATQKKATQTKDTKVVGKKTAAASTAAKSGRSTAGNAKAAPSRASKLVKAKPGVKGGRQVARGRPVAKSSGLKHRQTAVKRVKRVRDQNKKKMAETRLRERKAAARMKLRERKEKARLKQREQAAKLKQRQQKIRVKEREREAKLDHKKKIMELKRVALLDEEPRVIKASGWVFYLMTKKSEIKGPVADVFKQLAKDFRALPAAEAEKLRKSSVELQQEQVKKREAWLKSKTPLQIKNANRARSQLKRLKLKTRSHLQDSRLVKEPRSAYTCFTAEKIVNRDPGVPVSDVMKKSSKDWKNLTNEQKKPYIQAAEDDKKRFLRESKAVYGSE